MLLVRSMPMALQKQMQDALQYAIQLELATIPPYLTAMYSLTSGTNDGIAQLIRGIVIQEMQHMALAANMLNAIGGQPALNRADVIPKYPGGLPFHIGDRDGHRFEVPLKPFSLDVVENVFMRIEEPDEPIQFPVSATLAEAMEQQFQTIGDFYRSVRTSLKPEWFTGDPARQVQGIVSPVLKLADALAAIDLIVEQGEGTTTSPLSGTDIAHYYRFAEIFHGRTLVPDSSVKEKFSYSGAPIPFDPTGVLPLVANPTSALYPEGSTLHAASDSFNLIYSNLLRTLHVAFNGQPDSLDDAIGQMFDLRDQAMKLMDMPIGNGTNAAPCYEFVNAPSG